jgi:colanic acid/amylovoran biosynthesis glycosyltransferase
MKIAFLVWRFPVLSEPFILNQITGLIDRGHQVHIYPLNGLPENCTKIHPIIEKYNLLDHTYYPPTVPKNYLWRILKGVGLILGNIPQGSLSCLQIAKLFKYQYQVSSLKWLYRAIPFLKNGNYDIIHCQFGTLSTMGLLFRHLGILSGKLITTFRGIDISRYVQENGEQVYDRLFQEGDFFLANCEFFRHKAIKLGCPEARIIVHGSGIDCHQFAFKPRLQPTDGKIKIVTTGRLVEKKGIEYAIRAVVQVAAAYPNLEYNIIGDGELKLHFEQIIQELNAGKFIKLLGWKQQQELIEILDRSHNQDAPVNTLKEAMAMGLPVISTEHGGIPELVEDGISGFLVPEKDRAAIAQKLTYLIENSHLWPQIGRAGRSQVETKYDMEKLNDELVQIYESLCQGSSLFPIPCSLFPVPC